MDKDKKKKKEKKDFFQCLHIKKENTIRSLNEVEHFLKSISTTTKSIKIYKNLKH